MFLLLIEKRLKMTTDLKYSPSTYIVQRAPARFGLNQVDYQRRANCVISMALRKIEETPKTETDLSGLFFELLSDFEKVRQKIALDHGSEFAERFGTRRDREGTQDHYYTFLDSVYEEYGKKILQSFAEKMRSMNLEKKSSEKKVIREEGSCMNKMYSFELEILESTEIARLGWDRPPEEEKLKDFPGALFQKREKQGYLSQEDAAIFKQKLKEFKTKHPDAYKHTRMSSYLIKLQSEFPSPPVVLKDGKPAITGNGANLKSFFALATLRLEVETEDPLDATKTKKSLFGFSQYLTWLYRDFHRDPVDRMLEFSTVMLCHQDNYLIESSLKEISKIFAKCILSERTNLQEIKNLCALFRLYFANCMPDERGSVAEAEWFETTMYQFHRYFIKYKNDKLVDLEAFHLLPPKFMEQYEKMVEISEAQ